MELRRRTDLFGGPSREPRPLTVSEVNAMTRRTLESAFGRIVVRGEISNFSRAFSGHLYFTLKDARSQVAAVMWRDQAVRLPADPSDGLSVRVTGRLTVYEARGIFQLVVEQLDLEGAGALEVRLRELRAEYERRGWFAAERKRPLPLLPRAVGLITSPHGAAILDLLETIHARFPRMPIAVYPVPVQGRDAARAIAAALDLANRLRRVDVLIVGRGGGSLEDLWAFNEAPVVEAIHRSEIPVISAVGHEVDVTLSDLVADHRALTPTAAGEVVVPRARELDESLDRAEVELERLLVGRIAALRSRLESLARSWALREPRNVVDRERVRLTDLARRLDQARTVRLVAARSRLEALANAPALRDPTHLVSVARERLADLRARAERAATRRLVAAAEGLGRTERLLKGLSPFAVLERGYSLTTRDDGGIVRRAEDLDPGDPVTIRLAEGRVRARIDSREAVPGEGTAGGV